MNWPGSFRHPTQWIIRIRFSIESSVFKGSVVPIASQLMVRFEFYNGALMKFVLESIFSVFIGSRLLIFFYEQIYLVMGESVLMRSNTAFSEMTHKPYIYWNDWYINDILFLSFSHPSIYLHTFLSKSDWFFYAKKISVATMIWPIYHILTGFLYPFCIQIMRSNELVIGSIVISS